MKNATHPADTSQADDEIRYERPDSITPEQWEDIKATTRAWLDEQVEKSTRKCQTYAWCVDAGTDDHEQHHSSNIVELLTDEVTAKPAVWCWLVRRRGADRRDDVTVVFEGERGLSEGSWTFEVPAWALGALQAVVEHPEGRKALQELVQTAEERLS